MQNLVLNDNEDAYDFATDFKPDSGQLINEIINQFGTQSNIYSGLEALGDDDEYGEASSDEPSSDEDNIDDGSGEYIPNEEGEMDE